MAKDLDFFGPDVCMDVMTTQAMWDESNVSTTRQRVINRYITQLLGRRLLAGESELRKTDDDFLRPITNDHPFEGKKVNYYYHDVDNLMQQRVEKDYTSEDFDGVDFVDIVVGADHGKDVCLAVMKILLRNKDKTTGKVLELTLGKIDCKKDDADLFFDTIGKPIAESIERLKACKTFNVVTKSDGTLRLALEETPTLSDGETIMRFNMRIFVSGDLKFYASILGRDNMSSYWCMWCTLGKNQWKCIVDREQGEAWTIDLLTGKAVKIAEEKLTDAQAASEWCNRRA